MNHWSLISHVVCSKSQNSHFFKFALIFGPLCYYVCTHIWTLFLKFALIFGPSCVRVCTHIWTDLWPSLHSYLDPLVMKFALIYGPSCDQVCTHIWTDLLWSLHSYLDPLVKKFALIIGPPRYRIKAKKNFWFFHYMDHAFWNFWNRAPPQKNHMKYIFFIITL